jgi:hypothetical protein
MLQTKKCVQKLSFQAMQYKLFQVLIGLYLPIVTEERYYFRLSIRRYHPEEK